MSVVRRESPARSVCTRRLALFALAAGAAHCLTGCDTLHLFSLDKADVKVEKDSAQVDARTLPGKSQFRIAPYVFYSDIDLKPEQPLFRDLESLRDQVYKELHLPSGAAVVHVYLFENAKRYDNFIEATYPKYPRRRAFFMALPTALGGEKLVAYAVWGDNAHIQQDLRHELTHALLHSVLKTVPIWLDEGLAEYFELPANQQGVNAAHLEQLRHPTDGTFKPDLARLEAIQENEVEKMNRPEYREAWAWVHLMLRSKPEAKAVLLTYLQQFRTNREVGPIAPKLAEVFPSPEEALEKHLAQLEEATARTAPPPKK